MDALETCDLLQRSPHAYFKKALALFEAHQFPSALQAIDAAIVFSHNAPFYIYQKIRLLYQLGALKNCSELILAQLEHLYRHASLYLLCRSIDYLQQINQYDSKYLAKILKHRHIPYCLADSYQTLLTQKNKPFMALAKKAMVQDDYPLCLCYCELYLKIHSKTPEILSIQAYAYHMLGDLVKAKNSASQELKISPKKAPVLAHLGAIFMEIGDYSSAIDAFKKAASLEPTNTEYLLYLGECYYVAKKTEAAISTYERIALEDPSNLQNYFNLSHTYKKLSKRRLSNRYSRLIKKHLRQKQAQSDS